MKIQPRIKGIILSIEKYNDDEDINLNGIHLCTKQIYDSLMYNNPNVELDYYKDQTSTAIKNELATYWDRFECKENNDIFLFYYCGHGFPSGENRDELLLSCNDTTLGNVNQEVGLKLNVLLQDIKRKTKKYIVILDCCFSNLANRMSIDNLSFTELEIIDNMDGAVIISSASKNYAYLAEIDQKKYPAFSWCFANVLRNGIENENALISIKEIFYSTKELLENNIASACSPEIKEKNDLASKPIITNNYYAKNIMATSVKLETGKLKVLLVKSVIQYPIMQNDFGVPLGLWLLKSYMRQNGINVHIDIFDERLVRCQNGSETYENLIKEYDVVGISVATSEVPDAMRKLYQAKQKGLITLLGGIFTFSNEEYLLTEHDYVDYVIPGVSTLPMARLLEQLNIRKGNNALKDGTINHIEGVFTRQNCSSSIVWKPSQLPYIEISTWMELVNQYKPYMNGKMDIFTARGCNKVCEFCSVQKECRQQVIERDIKSVVYEIEFLYNQGFRYFSIKDEDFLIFGHERILDIMRFFKKHDFDLAFKLRTRADEMVSYNIDFKELSMLGVKEIQYGIETTDSILLNKIKKGCNYNNIVPFLHKCIDNNIIANCSFILGIIGETIEYYDNLLRFFSNLSSRKELIKVYINFLSLHPFKNEFPDSEYYSLVTNELQYYTHKIPTSFPKGMKREERIKMLSMYDEIVKMYDASKYNPPIPELIRKNFIDSNKTAKKILPKYIFGR